MLGTGSRQILVTFYQVPTCQRFPLTPMQGAANLLSAQHAHSPMATPQHGMAQHSGALLKTASPSEHPPSAQPMLLGQPRVTGELLALAEGCSSTRVRQED